MKSQKLHDALTSLLYQLERDGDIGPMLRLINDTKISRLTQLQITAWIETFTPFRFTNAVGTPFSARKVNKKKPWRTSEAQRNPYWLTVDITNNQCPSQNASQNASQEIAVAHSRKLIKNALDEFLRAPTKAELEQLTLQMNEYLKFGITKVGLDAAQPASFQFVNFVSGGLPSLGKRAK